MNYAFVITFNNLSVDWVNGWHSSSNHLNKNNNVRNVKWKICVNVISLLFILEEFKIWLLQEKIVHTA